MAESVRFQKDLEALVKYVDKVYLKYGASEQVYGETPKKSTKSNDKLHSQD